MDQEGDGMGDYYGPDRGALASKQCPLRLGSRCKCAQGEDRWEINNHNVTTRTEGGHGALAAAALAVRRTVSRTLGGGTSSRKFKFAGAAAAGGAQATE